MYVDGRYSFSLSKHQLEQSDLRSGREITAADVEQYAAASTTGKLLDRAFRQLARRPRSKWEIRDYLRRKDATDEQIQEVMKKLESYGYVDDREFTESWVRSRRALKPTSQKKLRFELRKKRVDPDIVEAVLAEDETNEVEQLKALIEKKRQQARYQDNQKLMAYCARQGFRYGDIKQALEELAE